MCRFECEILQVSEHLGSQQQLEDSSKRIRSLKIICDKSEQIKL